MKSNNERGKDTGCCGAAPLLCVFFSFINNLNKSVKIWRQYRASSRWSNPAASLHSKTIASIIFCIQCFYINSAISSPSIIQRDGLIFANQSKHGRGIINLSQGGLVKVYKSLRFPGLDSISSELVHQHQKISLLTLHIQDAVAADSEPVNKKPSNNGNGDGSPSGVYYANWLWYHYSIFYVLSFLAGGGVYAIMYFTRPMTHKELVMGWLASRNTETISQERHTEPDLQQPKQAPTPDGQVDSEFAHPLAELLGAQHHRPLTLAEFCIRISYNDMWSNLKQCIRRALGGQACKCS